MLSSCVFILITKLSKVLSKLFEHNVVSQLWAAKHQNAILIEVCCLSREDGFAKKKLINRFWKRMKTTAPSKHTNNSHRKRKSWEEFVCIPFEKVYNAFCKIYSMNGIHQYEYRDSLLERLLHGRSEYSPHFLTMYITPRFQKFLD